MINKEQKFCDELRNLFVGTKAEGSISKLRQCIDILKGKILNSKSAVVRIKDNKVCFDLDKKYERDISSYSQTVLGELGRALIIIDLVERHKIPHNLITMEERSIVGSPSKRIDIKIKLADTYKQERECIALVECKTSVQKISEQKFTDYFKKQLYNIAHSYAKDKNQPYPLVLITYEVSCDDGNDVDIFYRWFLYEEIERAIDTGQILLDKIISKNSSFAYDTSPRVSGNKVYFHKSPLKKSDLIEITNPDEFKILLKEKLHQKLRNYGVVEDRAFYAIKNLLLAKTFDEIELLKREEGEPDFQVRPEDYINKQEFYNRIKRLLENALVSLLGEDSREARKERLIEHENEVDILLDIVPYLQRSFNSS